MRHFRSILDIAPDELGWLIESALELKSERARGVDQRWYRGRILGLLFEKPSMRTRVSFEAAMIHLGGSCVFLTGQEVGLGKRESAADVAKVISTYVDLLAVRTFSHDVVLELAANAQCPVINALSDYLHPCQSLADMCTIKEAFGRLEGLKLVFVGDGNNVARSLAFAAAYCGLDFVLSAPPGFEFTQEILEASQQPGLPGRVSYEPDPAKAVADADVVYTDVWASMGQEALAAERGQAFAGYQVDAAIMARAKPTAKFLHCLPAHRGEEVSAEVIDGPQSLVVPQAENRLHAQKALICWLLSDAARK
jgi:ornithine carbamoyltransferase